MVGGGGGGGGKCVCRRLTKQKSQPDLEEEELYVHGEEEKRGRPGDQQFLPQR
jgi:hypothetical protein